MKTFSFLSLLLALIAGFAFLSTGHSSAQSIDGDKENKKAGTLSAILSRKYSGSPFVVITPSELEKLGDAAAGGPCDTAQAIEPGSVNYGIINQSDCRLDDNSYADFYQFNGTAGQQVPIFLSSNDFDTYLGIANLSGTYVVEDDDGGDGTNSYLLATLPETGTYIVLVNTAFANQFGTYTLSLSSAPYCAWSINPTSADVPGAGGAFSFQVTTQIGCPWRPYVESNYFIQTDTTTGRTGSGTVTYTVSPNGPAPRSGTITVVPGYTPSPHPNRVFTVNQAGLSCSYSIASTSINLEGAEFSGSFDITAPAGCFWSASSNAWFIHTTSQGIGSGTVNYVVGTNNGVNRSGTITVAGHTFSITQAGLNCTYGVSPLNIVVDRDPQAGQIAVTTQPGCTWNIFRNSWVSVNQVGNGSGTATFHVFANPTPLNRTDTISFNVVGAAGSTTIQITQTATSTRTTPFDFDGDLKTDVSIFRPSLGEWWVSRSGDGNFATQFGASTEVITPADYTGDGKTDIAFWRPATGEWFVLRSEDLSFYSFAFGTLGDVPVPGDYDGDGKADATIYRPSTQLWYISKSAGGTQITQFGTSGDVPAAADYDGDGRMDIAIYRPTGANGGEWWIKRSSNPTVLALQFGTPTDKTVQGDYTGDGKADIAFWRPSTGGWFVLRSEDFSFYSFPFGSNGDIPVPGDYDGDGRNDAAVFRPSTSTWFAQRATGGTLIKQFGIAGDIPLPSAYVR